MKIRKFLKIFKSASAWRHEDLWRVKLSPFEFDSTGFQRIYDNSEGSFVSYLGIGRTCVLYKQKLHENVRKNRGNYFIYRCVVYREHLEVSNFNVIYTSHLCRVSFLFGVCCLSCLRNGCNSYPTLNHICEIYDINAIEHVTFLFTFAVFLWGWMRIFHFVLNL